MKIWKKLLQVDKVHSEFIGNGSHFIRTTPLLLLFIPYKFTSFSSHDDKV